MNQKQFSSAEIQHVLLRGARSATDLAIEMCEALQGCGFNICDDPELVAKFGRLYQFTRLPASIGTEAPLNYDAISPALIAPGILQPDDSKIAQISNYGVLQYLRSKLRAGRAPFRVGTIIPDLWTDPETGIIYSMPLILVDYRKVRLVDGNERFGAILLRQNASLASVCFDQKASTEFNHSDLKHWLNRGDYFEGCSSVLREVTAEIMLDREPVKFFPPSLEELHLDPYDNPELEDLVWEYFRDTPTDYTCPCPKRVFRNYFGTAQLCWLRSAYRSFAFRVWVAFTDGSAVYHGANFAIACSPACAVA